MKLVKVLAGAAGGAVVVTTAIAIVSPDDADATVGVVTRVIDGDTFEAEIDGDETAIRLLNIDTPETKDPNKNVECLGPEATQLLQSLLPVGETIDLEYDEVREDRYERTLAGVTNEDGKFVNAEIGRAGLGVAVEFDGNDRFLSRVERAVDGARDAKRGLFSDEHDCTVPGQVAEAERQVAETTSVTPAQKPKPLLNAADDVDEAAAAAGALAMRLGDNRDRVVWDILNRNDRAELRDRLHDAQDRADARADRLTNKAEKIKRKAEAEAEARRKAAAEEKARKEAEEKARREAEERAQTEESDDTEPEPEPEPEPEVEPWNAPGPDLDCGDIRQKGAHHRSGLPRPRR